MTSLENAVLEQVLRDFRGGLQSKIPLELKHCIDFLDEFKILELATQEETKALKKLLENLSKLENPDRGRVKAAVEQFDSGVEDIIQNEFVSKHKGFKKEAEVLPKGQVDTLHANMKASIESRSPNLDFDSLKKFIEEGKQRMISDFEFHWSHANVTLFHEQKEHLRVMLEELEQEALGNRRRQMEGQMSTSNDEHEMPETIQDDVRIQNNDSGCAHNDQSADVVIPTNNFDNEEDSDRELGNGESSRGGVRGEKRRREDPQVQAEDGSVSKRPNQQSTAIMPGCSTSGLKETSKKNDSLIFRPGSHSLKMAMFIDGTLINEHCSQYENIKWHIHSALGVDEQGQLTSKEDTSLGEHSLFSLVRSPKTADWNRKPISFKLGGGESIQSISIEFVLGFLLKLQKESAEINTKRKFGTAVIIVPIWLTSSKRIQFKDAAIVAGFENVHLLNEESIEGRIYAVDRLKKKCVVLVLGKTFGIVSAILYESNGKAVNMLADTYFDDRLPGADFYDGVDKFLSKEIKHLDSAVVRRRVVFSSGLDCDMDELFGVLYGFGFVQNEHGSQESGVDPESISFLRGRTVEEIRKAMREYLPRGVGYRTPVNIFHPAYNKIIKMIEDKTEFPKQIELELPLNLLGAGGYLNIVQDFLIGGISKSLFPLGRIDHFGREISSKEQNQSTLNLTVEISSDAILSVKDGSFKLVRCGKTLKCLAKDVRWESANLPDYEKTDLRRRVRLISEGKL